MPKNLLRRFAQRLPRPFKKPFWYLRYHYLTWRFQRLPFSAAMAWRCDNQPLSDPEQIDLVTIAFNNPLVIEYQIKLLRRNLTDAFSYTVADNSSESDKQAVILKLCQKYEVAYLKLPPNPHTNPSYNHGAALTWVYHNYIKTRATNYFGFLDHDIFPVKPTRLIPQINRHGVFGLVHLRGRKWYLWAGFCFFNRQLMQSRRVDFRPSRGLDSGGRNWSWLYSKIKKIPQLKQSYRELRTGEDPQSDWVEYIGDWLHTINASNWKPSRGKNKLIADLLKEFSEE